MSIVCVSVSVSVSVCVYVSVCVFVQGTENACIVCRCTGHSRV